MKLGSSSTDLEQLVARIHKLVEPEGTTVTWNERVRDPDTGRLRQIDGTIERDGKRIHIECRDHGSPQDVKWIEELIGRRLSLRVDGIIGVSASGYTGPAVKKADAFGVILRTLAEMTDAEIQAWGKTANFSVFYIEISEFELTPIIDYTEMSLVTQTPELKIPGKSLSPVFLILQNIAEDPQVQFCSDRFSTVKVTMNFPSLQVDGAKVLDLHVLLKGRLRQEIVKVVSVWNYDGVEPDVPPHTVISKHGDGETEIIQCKDNASMILDLSVVNPPSNCFLSTFQVDFGRVVTADIKPLAVPQKISAIINTTLDVKALSP